MRKKISILGSTGSIGIQALEVAKLRGFDVIALAAHSNIEVMEAQIRAFKPHIVAMMNEKAAAELKIRAGDTATQILGGIEGVCACAQVGDTVLNGIVGMAGLLPTLAAIDAGKEIALANKETLVAAGDLVMKKAQAQGVRILPVDSEHSAIFQSLQGCPDKNEIKRLILTASGGPFFGKTAGELEHVSIEQALNHPNWIMGAKITIDSATMMNKGLELIEAVWLFDVEPGQVDILVHRQSLVHSLVEFADNSVIAQLGVPDMRIPIQYALTYPNRYESPVKQLRLEEWANLTFESPDDKVFPCMNLCRKAITLGGLYPAAANAANEVANKLFRDGKIKFLQIAEMVERAMDATATKEDYSLQDVLDTDSFIRKFVPEHLN